MLKAILHDTANPTMLKAGYKANVIPATAEAVVDCRVLPGRQAAFEAEVDELIGPDVTREWIRDLASYETSFDGDLVDAMNAAVLAVDPDGRTVPYMLSGGTDAKAFSRIGIRCFGFSPAAVAAGVGFRFVVPWRRRAGTHRCAEVRHRGAGTLSYALLVTRED